VCQIGDQHVGAMVSCGRCNKPFQARGVVTQPAIALPVQQQPGQPPAPMAIPVNPQAAGSIGSAPPTQRIVIPQAAPPGTYDANPVNYQPQVGIKEGLRGVFKAIVPFSKVDAAKPPVVLRNDKNDDDDVGFDFAPGAEAALRGQPAVQSAPPPMPVPAAGAWSPPAPAAGAVCRLDIGGATSTGLARKRNEDSFLVQQFTWCNLDQRHEVALIVVADGMGGHDAGDKASHIVIQAIGAALMPLLTGALTGQVRDSSPGALGPALEGALKNANQQVYRRAQSEPGCRGMGATASVVLIWNSQVVIGHVGDTRVYSYRAGKATQLTRDQTLVEKMVQLGQLTPQQAAVHPARNEVAQAVGRQPDVAPVTSHMKLLPGDWLFVACDGLHAHVDLAQLERTAREAMPSATFLAHKLVKLADERGGSDNCTVVAIHAY
jgi:protein phosphatase